MSPRDGPLGPAFMSSSEEASNMKIRIHVKLVHLADFKSLSSLCVCVDLTVSHETCSTIVLLIPRHSVLWQHATSGQERGTDL